MAENNPVVGSQPNAETEANIKEIQRSLFDMNKLSIAGKDYHNTSSLLATTPAPA
ncbi:MAG TPA: hypothetical protein VIE89_27780 [Candidatus Binatia bacterium]|jgi:hypothetical protein